MHTASQRIQNTFGYFSSVALILSVVISLVSLVQLNYDGAFDLKGSVKSVSPSVLVKYNRRSGSPDGKAKENLKLKFDLDADFSPLFNWNTKQIFVYLSAEYPGKRPDITNSVTFWDKIITSKDESIVHLSNTRGSYTVYDVDKYFPSSNATLKLSWNVQPYVGFLVYGDTELSGQSVFDIPDSQTKKHNI